MLSLMIAVGNTWLAAAQDDGPGIVDSHANGHPVAAKEDAAAVAELERAQELFAGDGKEREVVRIVLGLIEKFEGNEDFSHLVDSLFLAGDAYYYLGEWSNAENYMQQAYDLGNRYYAEHMSTYPLKVIGECQFEQEKYDESLATFQDRVQLLRKGDDSNELAGALFDAAGLLINLDRPSDAIPVLTEALAVNNTIAGELSKAGSGATEEERAGNVVDHAEIIYHLAIANYRLENFEETRTLLEQAEDFFSSINKSKRFDVRDRLVAVLDDLVLVCEKQGNDRDAEEYRKQRDELNR